MTPRDPAGVVAATPRGVALDKCVINGPHLTTDETNGPRRCGTASRRSSFPGAPRAYLRLSPGVIWLAVAVGLRARDVPDGL